MMDNRFQKSAESFVVNLTGAGAGEAREFLSEIRLNQEFHNGMKEKRSAGGKGRTSDYSVGAELGAVLYAVCRARGPGVVVETGVASGVSSSYILCALEKNKNGQLYSIDIPWWNEAQTGWLVPDYLRERWHLIVGRSSEKLTPLLKGVPKIDIFLHDSGHTFQNMSWEFQTAWSFLAGGGLLLAHNIDDNTAFRDFCRAHGTRGHSVDNLGGLVKT